MNALYFITQVGFTVITLVYYPIFFYLLYQGLAATSFPVDKQRRIFRNTVIVFVSWLVITGILSTNGFFTDFSNFPPPFAILIVVPLGLIIWATSRKDFKEIIARIPMHRIVYLQSFRIFVEILLWALLLQKLLPIQMSFEGRNYDILAGLTALAVGTLIIKGKISSRGIIIWNIASLALLINIVTIAILSTPTPLRVFMNEPANTIVTKFPIVWLPAVLVPLAYGLHIISIKQAIEKMK